MSKKVYSVESESNQPVKFPAKCVYCLDPVSQRRDKEIKASYSYNQGQKKITKTFRQKVRGIPLCKKHAELSENLSITNNWIIIISSILGIGAAITFQVTTGWVKEAWSWPLVGIMWGTIFSVLILIGLGKLIVGSFNREMWVIGATEGAIGMRADLILDEILNRPRAILFYFANEEYFKLFCELNGLVGNKKRN